MAIRNLAQATAGQSYVVRWTYTLLTLSLIPTIIGVWLGPQQQTAGSAIVFLILGIGLMLAALYTSERNPAVGALLFLAFAAAEGVSIAPLLAQYNVTEAGQLAVLKALIATAAIGGGLTAWTWIKGFDANAWGPYLFAALLGLVVVMVLSLFFPTAFSQTLISLAGVLIFSLYIVYDTSRLVTGKETNPVAAAISLYLDLLNLFLFLLRLFFSKSDD